MQDDFPKHFFITLKKNNGQIVGHRASVEVPSPSDIDPIETAVESDAGTPILPNSTPSDFADVFLTFVSMMESYRKFAPLTLRIAPLLYSSLAEKQIVKFVTAKGRECPTYSNDNAVVYKLDVSCYAEFKVYNDEIVAMKEGARILPEVMVIGLVSSYDAFLSKLIKAVLNIHPEIVLTSEKSIRFSELSTFSSVQEARETLINREVESAIRLSHHEQFSWMESRLSTAVRKNMPVWPTFVELCERRNLLTHTGGVISAQYLANCKEHGGKVTGAKPGDRLAVDSDYFARAVSTIYEIGAKLCHVFWRKFADGERKEADCALNECCYSLIYNRDYPLAESLLYFGTHLKKHSNDSQRRMMVVNLANSVRLQRRKEDAEKILDKEDWSAVDNNFKICVASVYGDIEQVLKLMPIIGAEGNPGREGYRTWPVFSGTRANERFVAAFEEIFGEPFIATGAVKIDQPADAQNVDIEVSDVPANKTLH